MYYLEALVSIFCLSRKEGLSVIKNLCAKFEEQKSMCTFSIITYKSVKSQVIFKIPGRYEWIQLVS